MKCPVCAVELKIYERQGIEVDYCPQCRGVWLDRGELDKIIEASVAETPPVAQNAPQSMPQQAPSPIQQAPQRPYHHDDDDDDYRYGDNRYDSRYDKYGKRKKRGMLGEIFDIFD